MTKSHKSEGGEALIEDPPEAGGGPVIEDSPEAPVEDQVPDDDDFDMDLYEEELEPKDNRSEVKAPAASFD